MTNNPLLSDSVVEAVARKMCHERGYGFWDNDHAQETVKLLTTAHKALTDAGFVVVPVEPIHKLICESQSMANFMYGRDYEVKVIADAKAALKAAQTGEVG